MKDLRSMDSAPKDGTHILIFTIDRWKVVWWHKTQRTIPEEEGWYDGWNFEVVAPDCWTDCPATPLSALPCQARDHSGAGG